MKDAGMIGAIDVPETESRQATMENRKNEDWSWMVGGDPAFYLEESDRSRGRD